MRRVYLAFLLSMVVTLSASACSTDVHSWSNVPQCQGGVGAEFDPYLVTLLAAEDTLSQNHGFYRGPLNRGLQAVRASELTVAVVSCPRYDPSTSVPAHFDSDAQHAALLAGKLPEVCAGQRTVLEPKVVKAKSGVLAFPRLPSEALRCERGEVVHVDIVD